MRPQTARSTKSPLLTVPELASLIGVNRSTLYRAINRGDFPLPIVRFGNRIQVPRAAAEKLIYGGPLPSVPGTPESGEEPLLYCASCSAPLRGRLSCSAGHKTQNLGRPLWQVPGSPRQPTSVAVRRRLRDA